MPERLELKLEPATQALSPAGARHHQAGGPLPLRAARRRPRHRGRDRRQARPTGRCRALPATGSAWPTSRSAPVRKPLEQLPVTDAEGKADIAVQLPACRSTSRPLEADVILKLRESGGRTIERTITLPVDMKSAPHRHQAAVRRRPGAAKATWRASRPSCSGPTARPIEAKGLKWELLRLDQRWQWYSRDGSWNYEPSTHTRRMAAGTADAAAGEPAKIEAQGRLGPLSPGGQRRRRLRPHLEHWCSTPATTPTRPPTARRCSTSPSTSRPTGSARRRASRSPRACAGRALIAVLNSGLASTQEVDLPAGGGEVAIRVARRLGARRLRHRACSIGPWTRRPSACRAARSGLRWLAVDQAPRMLNVGLDAAREGEVRRHADGARSRSAGLAAGEEARVTWPPPMSASST